MVANDPTRDRLGRLRKAFCTPAEWQTGTYTDERSEEERVSLVLHESGGKTEWEFTPDQARELGEMLIVAANTADGA